MSNAKGEKYDDTRPVRAVPILALVSRHSALIRHSAFGIRHSSSLRQQLLDLLAENLFALHASVVQLAIPAVAHQALLVDQVGARPVAVAPRRPRLRRSIDGDGVFELIVLHFLFNAL